MVNNGVMDDIQREIDTTFIVNVLDSYIAYTKLHCISKEDKDVILRFIVFLLEEGFDEGTD